MPWPRTGPGDAPPALSPAALSAGAQGRHAQALAAYDTLLPIFGRHFGAEPPQTLRLRSNLVRTLIALGRYAGCETECAAVARAAIHVRGAERQRVVATARTGQSYALDAQGRPRRPNGSPATRSPPITPPTG